MLLPSCFFPGLLSASYRDRRDRNPVAGIDQYADVDYAICGMAKSAARLRPALASPHSTTIIILFGARVKPP
jgi:hypothetical protein